MTTLEFAVATGALALIAWVNWYFFMARKSSAAAGVGASGVQEALIAVRGGYEPATVRLRPGTPVRLTFDRQEAAGCSDEVVFPGLGVKRFLPPFEKTTIELPAQSPGTYEFTCGMSMLRGRLVVEDDATG